jgi:ribonucleoside-diphosphate reductase alpha chain
VNRRTITLPTAVTGGFLTLEEKDNRMSKPAYINEFSQALLSEFYMQEEDSIEQLFYRAAYNYLPEYKNDLSKRILEYINKGWLMPSSPILSNSPKTRDKPSRHMPISCFLTVAPDHIDGQVEVLQEVAALSVSGGGVGVSIDVRAPSKKAPGAMAFIPNLDAVIGYFRQANSRRGSAALYMDIDHSDVREFIKIRQVGGDEAKAIRNTQQINNAVNITDEFIDAVLNDKEWELKCPATGKVSEVLKARLLWEEILEARALTGEPYCHFIDRSNRARPQSLKDKHLKIKSSNLCSEVTIPTNDERTGVCCLSSLNVEYFDEWKDTTIVEDAIEYLDYILQYFIENADHKHLQKAVFSAKMGRDLGLGTMGFHYYLQRHGIPFETGGFNSAAQMNHKIYSHIKQKALAKSIELGKELGNAPDMEGYEDARRNVNMLAIAPNSNSAIILQTSPSIDPVSANIFTQTTRAGSYTVKNKYFEQLLEKKAAELGFDQQWIDDQWSSIQKNEGSVQHLDYLTDEEKAVFKCSWEIDQHWVIEHAEGRAGYICQAQPVNLFFGSGVDKGYLNSVHLKALKAEKLKTLYYCRMRRSGKIQHEESANKTAKLSDYSSDTCLSCQG